MVAEDSGGSVEWDELRRQMLKNLKDSVRNGVLTPDQYPKAMADVMAAIAQEREQAEYRDLFLWTEELEAEDPARYADFVAFVRQVAFQRLPELGQFLP
jgi:hypothetical protein